MSKIVLQPASTGKAPVHYEATIENPRPLSDVGGFASPETLDELREVYGDRRAPIWDAVEGNRSRFNRMREGDLVLFSS